MHYFSRYATAIEQTDIRIESQGKREEKYNVELG